MAKGVTDLKELVEFARLNGLKSLKMEGIEFEFEAPSKPATNQSQDSLASLLSEEEDKEPTEDELLYWSTRHFDDLRGERNKALDKEI